MLANIAGVVVVICGLAVVIAFSAALCYCIYKIGGGKH